MRFWDVIYLRRAYRRFKQDPVPDWILEKILDAARWAPSWFNLQNLRYLIVRDRELIQFMVKLTQEFRVVSWMPKDYDRMSSRLWYLPESKRLATMYALTHGDLIPNALNAPVLIIPCFSTGFQDIPRQARLAFSITSLGCSVQNIWLAATDLGYGTCFIGAPFSMDERRREMLTEILGIPRTWVPICALPIGIPQQIRPAGPARFPLETMVFEEHWGKSYSRVGFWKSISEHQIPDPEFWDVVYSRRSVRKYNPDPIPDWMLERILDAARWAPSDENLQFVRYLLIRDPEVKNLISEQISEMELTNWMILGDGDLALSRYWDLPPRSRLAAAMESQKLMAAAVKTCPVVIIPCYTSGFWDFPGQHRDILSMISAGMGIQNLMLSATALGLGSWMIGTPFMMDDRRCDFLSDMLGIPRTWIPLGAICLGFPGEWTPPRSRFPLESLVFQETWGKIYIRNGFRSGGNH